MAVQKGSAVLVARGDQGSPESFTTIGGDTNAEFEYQDASGDYTHKSASGLWQLLMDGGTIRRLRITLSVVEIEDASIQAIFTALMGSGSRHASLRFTLPGLGTITGLWHCPSFGHSGTLDQAAQNRLTFESAGAPTYSAS